MHTESFAVFEKFFEFFAVFIHIKESIQITLIGCIKMVTDIAAVFFFIEPLSQWRFRGIRVQVCLFQTSHQGRFAGSKRFYLSGHLFIQFFQMCAEHQSTAETIAKIIHHFIMVTTEADPVSLHADIILHIRRLFAKYEFQSVLLGIPF